MAEYIEREALMKNFCGYDLTKCVKYGNKDANQQHDSYSTMMMYEIASEIEDAPAADVAPVRRWIPVTERLPEEKVNCIVHYRHAYCDNDDYFAIGVCFCDGEKFQLNPAYKVTYWMPLPEPPKEERP